MGEVWVVGWRRVAGGKTVRLPKEEHSGILVDIVARDARRMKAVRRMA